MDTALLRQASVLAIDEQIELVEAIWSNITALGKTPALSAAQAAELDLRTAEYAANPQDTIPWAQVKATAMSRIRP
jgi:putative addiction module component (TIGR02574 family)